jgi:hypothetical protein
MALFVAIVLAFLAETRSRILSEPESAGKWTRLRSYLRLRR